MSHRNLKHVTMSDALASHRQRAGQADQKPAGTQDAGWAKQLLAPYRLDDCGWVANRWCELLPMPVELKQRLMALDNPLLRLELVSDILERTGIAL